MMDPHPKDDAAKVDSIRLVKLLKRAAWLPVWCVLVPCGWLKRLFIRLRTPAELQKTDEKRQSMIRRQLRGLTPIHDATKPSS